MGKSFEEEEGLFEEEVINLDETIGWSKLDIAAQLAKQQKNKTESMLDEIGDELAILDVMDEDSNIELMEQKASKQFEEMQYQESDTQFFEEIEEEETEEEISEDEIEYFSVAEEEEEESPFAFFENLFAFFGKWSVMDHIVALTGVLVLVVAVVTAGAYWGKRNNQTQIEALAPIGQQLETVGIIGENTLLAVADAHKAMLETSKVEEEFLQNYEEETKEEPVKKEPEVVADIQIVMKLTSVEKDLKIKFVNKKSGKLITNLPFEVSITDAANKTYTKIDEDKDGIIYLTKLEGGTYSVTMTALDGVEGYVFNTSKQSVKVKETIVYQKVDVSEEVKDESQVDVSKEDTSVKNEIVTEGALTDTVEWVESNKTEISSEPVYVPIDKNDIADPSLSARISLNREFLKTSLVKTANENEASENDSNENTPKDIAVTGVTLDKSTLTLTEGDTGSLTAIVIPNDATNKTVTWTSSDNAVATVSGGTVTAIKAGTATITATAGGQTATCTVTVNTKETETVVVTGITLNKTTLSLEVEKTETLTATVTPDNATDKTVTWTSSDNAVATVSGGTVTAIKAGTATITATAGGKTATCTVTVNAKQPETVAVTGITLNKTTLSLEVEKTETLTATITPAEATDKTVTWTSSDSTVAIVSGGTVKALKVGTTTITAKAGEKTATCVVTVTGKTTETVAVTGITLNKTTLSLEVEKTEILTATVAPENATDKTVTWTSSDSTVATVSDGTVKAVKAGTATITAKAGEKTATCTVTVTEKTTTVAVTEVKLNKVTLSLEKGKTETLTVTVVPENATNKEVTWTSSDDTIVTVKEGVVTAVKVGKATIIAKAGEKTAVCEVEVIETKTEITIKLDKTTADLKVGESVTLKATVTPENQTVTWSTSKAEVATVENGKVTAKAVGTATITAKVGEKTATCTITVTEAYNPKTDTTTDLKDKSGNKLYYYDNGKYIEAKVADYYKTGLTFFKEERNAQYLYTGWQNLEGYTYFFDKNGNKVTGEQIIQGAKYSFNSDGILNTGSGILGIDVSKWNGTIDWQKVKNAGVSYAIIRTGYRGSSIGALIEDPKFRYNIQGAINAGIKVGVYFFTQAINEIEAVEEASMVINQIRGYKITYPVFIDVESSGGRADSLSVGARTKIINAFCQTIRNSGYTAGIYANKTWLNQKINVSALSGYKIWLAQYNTAPTYSGRYDMWQYSEKGRINGISTNVDLNLSYMNY